MDTNPLSARDSPSEKDRARKPNVVDANPIKPIPNLLRSALISLNAKHLAQNG